MHQQNDEMIAKAAVAAATKALKRKSAWLDASIEALQAQIDAIRRGEDPKAFLRGIDEPAMITKTTGVAEAQTRATPDELAEISGLKLLAASDSPLRHSAAERLAELGISW